MLLRFVAILCLLCCPVNLFATDWNRATSSEQPVNLEADELTYDKQSGRYQATGNVQLQQGDMELRSRLLWWNQASGEIEAEGDVELTAPAEKLTGSKARLLHFSVGAITGGTDAQGECTVRLEHDGREVLGQGAHPDIIVASAKAYIHALNKIATAPKRNEITL